MDYYELILNGALFICSCVAFVYGVVRFFKRKIALFNQLITCALGCMMLGRLSAIVAILTNGAVGTGFSVGKLGYIGGFLFLFSASYGQMDGLVDGGEKEFGKYRLLALLAPITVLAMYTPVVLGSANLETKIVAGVIIIFFAQCSYYNLKHLIIPDVDMGIIKSIRGYNLLVLIMTVLSAAELVFESRIITAIAGGLLCVVYLAVVPVLEKGARKWTM